MGEFDVYTRVCCRCSNRYSTVSKRSKVCKKCSRNRGYDRMYVDEPTGGEVRKNE